LTDRLEAIAKRDMLRENSADPIESFALTVHLSARVRSLSFAQLNLRRNPFGEMELADRAELAVVDVDRWIQRLHSPGFAVQFLGQRGNGKTTHLLAIKRRIARAAYVHVGEGQQPRAPRSHPLLIDEIQRLSPRRRRRVFRRQISLAVAGHEDLGAELSAAGYDVETVCVASTVDAQRVHEILNRRIDFVRRGPGPIPQVTLETAQTMVDQFGGNVRAIEGHIYLLFQQLEEVRHV
jgi:hypothetical protein